MNLDGLGNWIIILYLCYFTIYIFLFLFKQNREVTQKINLELERLRKISIKTLEEQKEFINLRYPKSQFKWTWGIVKPLAIRITTFIVLFRVYLYLFGLIGLRFSFMQGILFIFIGPIIINLILRKFNLHTNDITVFFR